MRSLRLYSEDGTMVTSARVTDLGFQKGMKVIRKHDSVVATIDKILPDHIHLLLEDGSLSRVSSDSFVAGQWKKHVVKPHAVSFDEWRNFSPVNSNDLYVSSAKGAVQGAMLQQYKTFKHEAALQVFLKPSKDVQVSQTFAVHTLKLPCGTPRLDVRPMEDTVFYNAIQVAHVIVPDDKPLVLYLLPHTQVPKDDVSGGFMNPAWVMKASYDKSDCNCELAGPSQNWFKQKLNPAQGTPCKVVLPFIRNFRKLNPGDSLVLYRPDLESGEGTGCGEFGRRMVVASFGVDKDRAQA